MYIFIFYMNWALIQNITSWNTPDSSDRLIMDIFILGVLDLLKQFKKSNDSILNISLSRLYHRIYFEWLWEWVNLVFQRTHAKFILILNNESQPVPLRERFYDWTQKKIMDYINSNIDPLLWFLQLLSQNFSMKMKLLKDPVTNEICIQFQK